MRSEKEIKVALIGCGGRGTGAASQSLKVPGTKLVAMADAFEDNLGKTYETLKSNLGIESMFQRIVVFLVSMRLRKRSIRQI